MLNLRVVQLIPRWTTDTFRLQITILTHVQCFNDNLPRDAILKLSFVMERYGVPCPVLNVHVTSVRV